MLHYCTFSGKHHWLCVPKKVQQYIVENFKGTDFSSIQVKERRFSGYNPTVIFQGKVSHRAGALLPPDGETPKFVQLYVFDPALENTQRYENMVLPTSVSNPDRINLKRILSFRMLLTCSYSFLFPASYIEIYFLN